VASKGQAARSERAKNLAEKTRTETFATQSPQRLRRGDGTNFRSIRDRTGILGSSPAETPAAAFSERGIG
jgi:hypothetical protein